MRWDYPPLHINPVFHGLGDIIIIITIIIMISVQQFPCEELGGFFSNLAVLNNQPRKATAGQCNVYGQPVHTRLRPARTNVQIQNGKLLKILLVVNTLCKIVVKDIVRRALVGPILQHDHN